MLGVYIYIFICKKILYIYRMFRLFLSVNILLLIIFVFLFYNKNISIPKKSIQKMASIPPTTYIVKPKYFKVI